MQLALSQVCSLQSPFEKDVEDYAAGQCRAMEVWLTKLETYLQTHTVADVRRLLDEFEMATPVASFQGGLLTSQGEARRAAWELFERRLASPPSIRRMRQQLKRRREEAWQRLFSLRRNSQGHWTDSTVPGRR